MSQSSFVAILMGSDSDLPVIEIVFKELRHFGIPFEVRILSAHRTPDLIAEYIHDADQRGCAIYIAAAGLAAHLAGAVAAHTIKPVIGIPLVVGDLHGLDALLATVQMPSGTPVACTAIGKAGAKNAAHLAAQILALQDENIANKIKQQRQTKRGDLLRANEKLQMQLA